VLSDVHANLPALQAVLARAERAGVDGLLCAGDVVGYGPQPDACADLVRRSGAVCVAGNHELLVLGVLGGERSSRRARASARWTRRVLREDTRAWLRTLPLQAQVEGVTVAHGSLDDVEEYVTSEFRARQQLAAAPQLVLGHTHRPWLHVAGATAQPEGRPVELPEGRPFLLNPGSVGEPRDGTQHARFAVLDLAARTVEQLDVPYDVGAARAAVAAAAQPLLVRRDVPLWAKPVRRVLR
jgi:predicted phosphodiesterase